MRAIVGLGNPGARYAATRHNIGFVAMDRLAEGSGASWAVDRQARSRVAVAAVGGRQVLLVKPQTYMNGSGAAVAVLLARLGWTPQDVLVVLDDFCLEFGRLRLRRRGSDGGHNGLASVIEQLQTVDFPRLRLGIGQPPAGEDAIDYVLRPFDPGEDVAALSARGCDCLELCLREGIAAAMDQYNGCAALPEPPVSGTDSS